jgi:hypothetical protein
MRSSMQQQLALIEEMEEGVRLLVDERAPAWAETDLRQVTEQAIEDKRAAAEARGVIATAGLRQRRRFCRAGDSLRLAPLLRHLLVHCIWRAAAVVASAYTDRRRRLREIPHHRKPASRQARGALRLANRPISLAAVPRQRARIRSARARRC